MHIPLDLMTWHHMGSSSSPTHSHGRTLDLVITSDDVNILSLKLHDVSPLSDHTYLRFLLPFMTYDTQQVYHQAAFEEELSRSELAVTQTGDVNWLFNEYNSYLCQLMDKHAPARCVQRRPRRHALWLDGECISAKRSVRRLEATYRRTRLLTSRVERQQARVEYRNLVRSKEKNYWSRCIADAAPQPRRI